MISYIVKDRVLVPVPQQLVRIVVSGGDGGGGGGVDKGILVALLEGLLLAGQRVTGSLLAGSKRQFLCAIQVVYKIKTCMCEYLFCYDIGFVRLSYFEASQKKRRRKPWGEQ